MNTGTTQGEAVNKLNGPMRFGALVRLARDRLFLARLGFRLGQRVYLKEAADTTGRAQFFIENGAGKELARAEVTDLEDYPATVYATCPAPTTTQPWRCIQVLRVHNEAHRSCGLGSFLLQHCLAHIHQRNENAFARAEPDQPQDVQKLLRFYRRERAVMGNNHPSGQGQNFAFWPV